MNIARVFPSKTKATPVDNLAFYDVPPLLLDLDIDKVNVSIAFTWDLKQGEFLAKQWEALGVPVEVGGPACGTIANDFIPNMYLKDGYTITSRGCPNHCWFCYVPKRQGDLIELEIKDGYIIQDDNLLACSEKHIRSVFEMLGRQKHKPIFTGGLEAKLLKDWHCELLNEVKTQQLFLAYDTPDDYEPLVEAGKMLNKYGLNIKNRKLYCYCLCGYKNDTLEKAEKRMIQTLEAGFIPFAMVYRGDEGKKAYGWDKFQREWTRTIIIYSRFKKYFM